MKVNLVHLLVVVVFFSLIGCTESNGRIITSEEEVERQMPDTIRSIEDIHCCNELLDSIEENNLHDELELYRY